MGESRKTSKLIIGVVVLLIGVGLLIWALSGRNEDPVTTTNSQTSETANDTPVTTTESESTATIAFTQTGFTPDTLTVKKGAVVTVRNESNVDVQFSSDEHPTHRDNSELNLSTLSPGESATFTADTVGEWGFHDHIDETKTGMLSVVE